MKNFVLFFVLFCTISIHTASAQFISIPDTSFRSLLKQKYPTCFNSANLLDTICAGNAADTTLFLFGDFSSPNNIEGIQYFKQLRNLQISGLIHHISRLPSLLKSLNVGSSSLMSLPPTLPTSLRYLIVDNNQLTNLPPLNQGLLDIFCEFNQITALPELPSSLRSLSFAGNQVAVLPPLPNSLFWLHCSNNPLTNFPTVLPSSLHYLNCSGLQLTSLPPLPSTLVDLYCSENQLTELPPLPNGIQYLFVNDNQLTSLPMTMPDCMIQFNCSNNQITCFPYINGNCAEAAGGAEIFNNPATCIPHQYSGMSYYLPTCNPTNNTNQCQALPKVVGRVFNDENGNGTKEPNESPRVGIKVTLAPSGLVGYTNEDGFYEIIAPEVDTFTVTTEIPIYYTTPQPSQTVIFTAYGQTMFKEFPLNKSTTPHKDFSISLTNTTPAARPGFPLHFRLRYENVGTIAGAAVVKFLPPSNYEINHVTVGNYSLSGDTLVWVFNNIAAGKFGHINIQGHVLPSTTLGSLLSFYASANKNDAAESTPIDNVTTLVLQARGSFNPNDKQGRETITPAQIANGDFLEYTIRFQNTGTDTAFTVVIADTLANALQAKTLKILSASHNMRVNSQDSIVYFEFLNILLPDSNANEPLSHGFVRFQIKPQANLTLGNTIQNKAAIYFDYNAPVITNTVTTTVANVTGISEKITNRLEVFPNPLEGEMLSIPNMRGASAKLFTLTGQELRSWTNIAEQISLQNVAAGMYLLEVQHQGQRRTAKVVVK